MKLTEGKLTFDFADCNAMRFDEQDKSLADYHDLQQMSKVDFIAELNQELYFIEVKDPGKVVLSSPNDYSNFNLSIVDGSLPKILVDKYIYTFTFRWAENKLDLHICLSLG